MSAAPRRRRALGVPVLGLALVLLLAGLAACSSEDGRAREGRHVAAPASTMRTMMRTTHPRSEQQYLVEMVAHHQDAITAAEQLSRSSRPQMRALGARIVASQSAQVATMTRWLDQWFGGGRPARYVPVMRDLTQRSGDALDRVFLEDMVPHHRMAVMMSRGALAAGVLRDAPVRTLARTIIRQQTSEIALMSRWERRWFGTSPGGGMMRGGTWRGGMPGMMRGSGRPR